MSEASAADLRARLDELKWDTNCFWTAKAALEAVLDLCDDEDQRPGGPKFSTHHVREEIAAALGVQRATPPCGHVDCGERWCRDQLRATPAEHECATCVDCGTHGPDGPSKCCGCHDGVCCQGQRWD